MSQAPEAAPVVRRELEKRGWTQNELARRVGCDSASMSRIMRGEQEAGLKIALNIEKVLGISPGLWVIKTA